MTHPLYNQSMLALQVLADRIRYEQSLDLLRQATRVAFAAGKKVSKKRKPKPRY